MTNDDSSSSSSAGSEFSSPAIRRQYDFIRVATNNTSNVVDDDDYNDSDVNEDLENKNAENMRMHASLYKTSKLRFKIIEFDGGEYSPRYKISNILINNNSVYCSSKTHNVNILLKYHPDDFTTDACFVLKSFVIKAPSTGYTAPCKEGIIFCSNEYISPSATTFFDDFTRVQFSAWLSKRDGQKTASDGCIEPIAFFQLNESTNFITSHELMHAVQGFKSNFKSDNIDEFYSHISSFGCDYVISPIVSCSLSDDLLLDQLTITDKSLVNYIVPLFEFRNTFANLNELEQLFEWVAFFGYHAVYFDYADQTDVAFILKTLSLVLRLCKRVKIIVKINFMNYRLWTIIRSSCCDAPNLFADVVVSGRSADECLHVWKAEPVYFLNLNYWEDNNAGYPTLTIQHQAFLGEMINIKPSLSVIIPTVPHAKGADSYGKYIKYFSQSVKKSVVQAFAEGYEDLLQTPLQPLFDNLDVYTYDVFMKDPVKYNLYTAAIESALRDQLLVRANVNILVVGAGGEGPLVSCAIKAINSLKAHQNTRLTAIEKNPYAVITLKRQLNTNGLWLEYDKNSKGPVRIISSDARFIRSDCDKFDIVISELLGSFGDNELSPECLQGIEGYLSSGGVMIPQSYSAFVAPICSNILRRKVSELADTFDYGEKAWHISYVSFIQQAFTDLGLEKLWEFKHPMPKDETFARDALVKFNFDTKLDFVLVDGLVGYFESILYETPAERIICSIHPQTHSPDMSSWFPMFFPFTKPLNVNKGNEIRVKFSRCTGKDKVWYEWQASVYGIGGELKESSQLMNRNGIGHVINL